MFNVKYKAMDYNKSLLTILALDDNELNLKLIKKVLEQNNYRVLTATEPKIAYEIFKNNKIDLAILDIKIKIPITNSGQFLNEEEKVNGYDVIKKIKLMDVKNQTPIIFLTSVSDPESKVKAFKAGAVDFITKPFNSSELVARIDMHIRLNKEKEQLFTHSAELEKLVKEKTKQLEDYSKKLEQMVEEKVGIIKQNNESLLKDMESARRLQIGLLPEAFPSIKNLKVDVHYRPCDQVGGDFYDVFNLDEAHVGFYVADVSGHGVSAAMVTFFVKELVDSLKKIIFPDGSYEFTSPSVIMEKVNLKILQEDFDGIYITMFYALFNTQTGELKWSNAGHIAYPLICRPSSCECEILKMNSMALGWFDYARYVDKTIKIEKGDKIVLYTDGVTDSKNKNGDLFGVDRVKNIIETRGFKNSSSLAFRVLKELRKFQRKKDLEDDITFLVIEYLSN